MFKPKTAKTDYGVDSLPKNRREIYFDVLKLHFPEMLMYGGLMLLFAFPVHFVAMAGDFYQMQIYSSLPATPGEEQISSVVQSLMTFEIIRNLINIPLLVLFSVGLAGMARIIRQYSWGENVYFSRDFALGVRQNGRQFALIALIAGVIAFVCNYISIAASAVTSDVYGWLGIIPSVLCAVFLIPVAGYALVACSCYENKFSANLKIGRVCYFRYLWRTLLAVICCIAVFIVQMLPFFWCHLIGRIAASLLIPFILLGWYLFAMGRLDEAVNKKLHPELVNKGIYIPGAAVAQTCGAVEEKSDRQGDGPGL